LIDETQGGLLWNQFQTQVSGALRCQMKIKTIKLTNYKAFYGIYEMGAALLRRR